MRIVTLQEFGELPAGTIFSFFEPAIVRGLMRKGETIKDGEEVIDFFLEELIPAQIEVEAPVGSMLRLVPIQTRWGEFSLDAEFVVYDSVDINELVDHLLNEDKPRK